jgi:iron complex outermembrane receptor protein
MRIEYGALRVGVCVAAFAGLVSFSTTARAQTAAGETTPKTELPPVVVDAPAKKPKAAKKKSKPAQTAATSQPPTEAAQAPAARSASETAVSNAQAQSASITVVPRQTIDDYGIGTVQEAGRKSPNVVLTTQGSPRFSINTIRGIGNTVRDDYFNSSIGVYLDGVPLSNADFSRRIGDIDHIEVLRGPQGTLFGHNAIGGVINMTSRAPTAEPRAEVSGTIGSNGLRESSAWLSGAIAGETLTGRLFFDYATRDGFTDYADFDGSIDGLDSVSGSGSLRYAPTRDFTATLSGAVEHVDQGAYAFLPFDDFERRVVDIAPPNEEVRDSRSVVSNVAYDFGGMRLASISGWRGYEVSARQDLAYNPTLAFFGGGRTSSEEEGRQFSQELRLSGGAATGLRWLVGAFYLSETIDFDYIFDVPAFGPASLSSSIYDRTELAAFGEATLAISKAVDLTAGVRLAREHHELANNTPFEGDRSFDLVTPKFAATYHFDETKHAYVSATRGARSGGFNRLATVPGGDAYASEYLWSYEAGFKTEWWGRSLTLNGAAFYIDWTNQQIKSFTTPGIIETTNAGKSHSQGVELEASWRPMREFELSGFIGFIDAEYDEYINTAGINLAGHTLVNTPEMTTGLAAEYRWPLAGLPASGFVRGEFLYTGDQYFDAENRLEQEAYGLVNLRTGIDGAAWTATVFAKNLFDTDYRTYGYQDFLAYDLAIAGDGRLVGVTMDWRY